MADTTLGEAQVPVRVTTDRMDSDLNAVRGKVTGALGKISDKINASMQMIGRTALVAGGVAIAAIAGAVVGLGKLAIDAAPVEGIRDAFEGLAASAGVGGDAMLSALQKGSAGMISQRDLMLSFNKAASLVSTDFATKLPDAMGFLGKVAAATGQDMGFLMDSLVIGVGRVSPMILDNLGIQVSLADATARASEMFGVEAGELTKVQQQAGMMNVVLAKLAATTASMPDTTESAAAKLAQLSAGLQDTRDRVGLALVPALTILLGLLADLAERVLPPLMRILEGPVARAFERVAQVAADLFWMLSVGVEPLSALKMALTQLVGPEVAEKIMEIVDAVSGFIETAKEVLGPIVEWVTENAKLEDVLIALGLTIASVVLPALWGIIAAAAPVIGVFLVLAGLVALIRSAWEEDFLGIRTFVETTLATIKEWWSEHGEEVKAKALEIWETVKTTIAEKWEEIKTGITEAIGVVEEEWEEHGDEIKAEATEIWEDVLATLEWFGGQYETLFAAFRLASEGEWFEFGAKLREVWDAAWLAIETTFNTFIDETDWEGAGETIVIGIAKGVAGSAGILAKAIDAVVRAAIAAVSGFFGTGLGVYKGSYPGLPGQGGRPTSGVVIANAPPIQGPAFAPPIGPAPRPIHTPTKDRPAFGLGTNFAPGGWSWVGERGPELLNIPRGAQIMSSLNSLSMVSKFSELANQMADAGRLMEHVARPNGRGVTDNSRNVEINVEPHFYRGDEPSFSEEIRGLSLFFGTG